jgi:tRNA pseudouridine55 synthase
MTLPEELLLIDKPVGMTSHDVVDEVRRVYRTRRVGHAGTLDPFATGLLIIGVDRGTKKLTNLVGLHKTYIATARLGATSTTDDPEGQVTETDPTTFQSPTPETIESALSAFRGSYVQTAPIYSAKKVHGKKLYELARKGLGDTVELPKKLVSIDELRVITFSWPHLTFEVSCSSGTYIRALARDIGAKLGCGAYLTALHRTRIGDFRIEDATTLEGLQHTAQ